MTTVTDEIIDADKRVEDLKFSASISMHPCRQARLQWEVAIECNHVFSGGDTRCQRCMSDTLQRDALSFYRSEEGLE